MNKLKLNITKNELLFMGSGGERGRVARQELSLQVDRCEQLNA